LENTKGENQMSVLNRDAAMIGNGKYTFRFQSDGFGLQPFDSALLDDIISVGMPIDNVAVNRPLFSGELTVTFTVRSGAMGWTVQKIAENMEAAMSGYFGLQHYTFSGASTGIDNPWPIPPELIFGAIALIIVAVFTSSFAKGIAEKV
jgi:hypothetical protein